MATPLNTILSWFETGDYPTQEQFQNSWSSFYHKDEAIPMDKVQNLNNTLQNKVDKSVFETHLSDAEAHTDNLAKKDASNLSETNKQAWKTALGVGELPPNIATVDDGANAGNVYTKMQSDEAYMQKSQYTNGDGKILADMIEALGLTRIKKVNEHTLTDFIANYLAYEYEESDIIAIPSTDPEPKYSLYFYTEGDKAVKENYLQTGFSNVTMSMVDGLIDALNDKVDKPSTDGKFYIKRQSGVTTTEVLADETLTTVVNRNNYSPKPITFLTGGGQETFGQIGVNPTTYSFFWGNMNPTHTGIYNHSYGYGALEKVTTGNNNLAFGAFASKELTTGKLNTVVGITAGQNATTGNSNVIIGEETANKITTGYKNTYVGTASGYSNTTGNLNTFIGYKANNTVIAGDRNVIIGAFSGQGVTGTNNVLLGVCAGMGDGAINNKLIIHSNNTLSGYGNDPTQEGTVGSPQQGMLSRGLITGDFLDRWVRVNGTFTVGTPATNANDIQIDPATGIRGAKLYNMTSNYDYVQRGYLFELYYNSLQIDAMLEPLKPYKVYNGLLAFTGSPALPNFVVFENTIGDIIWERTNVGEYIGTLNGAFPQHKVWSIAQLNLADGSVPKSCIAGRLDDDRIFVKVFMQDGATGSPAEVSGEVGSIEIRVYN